MKDYFKGMSTGEIAYNIIAMTCILLLVVYLIGSSNGFFANIPEGNYLAANANAAGPFWKIGNMLYVAAFYIFYKMSDAGDSEPSIGLILSAGACIALGVCVNCGFNFSIG